MSKEQQDQEQQDQEQPDKEQPGDGQDAPASRFVTKLLTIERQVGEHVLIALEQPETVAVLTTVASGIRNDRVVSVPLSREQVEDITSILAKAQEEPDEEDDSPTIGFHVVLDGTDTEEEEA